MTATTEQLASLGAGTTDSFEALKHYLVAESLLREAEYRAAFEEVDRALEIDSTFALAWYLKSKIDGWINQARSSDWNEIAERYKDKLPSRIRRLVEASTAFDQGRREDAIRLFTQLLRENPNDLEAVAGLAEVLEHYGFKDSDQRRSLDLFNQIAEVGGDNSQYAMHLLDHTALVAYRDSDYHPLDSLAAALAGMPIPERGDSLDWGEALSRMSEGERRYAEPYVLLRGSPADSAIVIDALMDNPDPGFNGFRLAFYSDLDAASVLMETNRVEAAAGTVDWFRYMLSLSSGRTSVLFAALPNTYDSPDSVYTLVEQVLIATMPVYDATAARLDSFQTALDQANTGYGLKTTNFEIEDALYPYLQGLIAWRQGDTASLESFLADVITAYEAHQDSETTRTMVEELSGLRLWLTGDLDGAIARMRQAGADGIGFDEHHKLVSGRAQPYWFLAEMLVERGSERDIEEAIEWYSHRTANTAISHGAPGWERMAQLHDQLGHDDEAIRYYGLFVDRWKEADGDQKARVEDGRARLNSLLDKKAREGA